MLPDDIDKGMLPGHADASATAIVGVEPDQGRDGLARSRRRHDAGSDASRPRNATRTALCCVRPRRLGAAAGTALGAAMMLVV